MTQWCLHHPLRFLTAIGLAVFLWTAAFAQADDPPMKGTDDAMGPATKIPVRFVTMRNRTDSADVADGFGGVRGSMRGGVCTVAFSPIPALEGVAKAAPFYIPDGRIELTEIREMQVAQLLDEVTALPPGGSGNIVIYIHGYNIGFGKSCRRAATFQRALGLEDRLLLISWPADDNFLKYTWDESDLVWSVPRIAQLLKAITRRTGSEDVDVVAHSLGARGAVMALSRLSCRAPDVPLINELVLVAPDVDTDVFRQELPAVRRLTRRVTIYVSENDKALKLSNDVHGYPRLGEAGEHLSVFKGVETIDLSRVGTRRFSGHLYHLFHPAVIQDLTRLLHTGEPAAERPGLRAAEREGRPYWRMMPEENE
jgi:esterase/lipase superfamily enzyme